MLRRKQNFSPYWVRMRIFGSTREEYDDYYNWINQNEYYIIFGYGEFQWSEECVEIPVYYLEKADLKPGSPYIQSADWEKTPWNAPDIAIDWIKIGTNST